MLAYERHTVGNEDGSDIVVVNAISPLALIAGRKEAVMLLLVEVCPIGVLCNACCAVSEEP